MQTTALTGEDVDAGDPLPQDEDSPGGAFAYALLEKCSIGTTLQSRADP